MTSESAELVVLKSINLKLQDIIDIFKIKGAVATTLADFSKSDRPQSATDKPMPKTIGNWNIADKGCNKCGGKITWDNYKTEKPDGSIQMYPDHVDENGKLIDCPAYN